MSPPKTRLIIDTNALLDWLVFDDPSSRAFANAVTDQRALWLASPAMLDELGRVLARPIQERWDGARKRALTQHWKGAATLCDEPAVVISPGLRCRDPDDQKFVDLAVAQSARWLITRDRDLLALRRGAASVGLSIVAPSQWPGLDAALA